LSTTTSQNIIYEGSKEFDEFNQNSSLETLNLSIIREIWERFKNWSEAYIKPIFNLALRFLFELDFSSVLPTFEPKDSSSIVKELPFEEIFEIDFNEYLDLDLDIRMPPKRRFIVKVEIVKKKKATPKFFPSDFEFYTDDEEE